MVGAQKRDIGEPLVVSFSGCLFIIQYQKSALHSFSMRSGLGFTYASSHRHNQPNSKQEEEDHMACAKLKMLSWNILEGACRNWQDGAGGVDIARLQYIQTFLQENDFDIVVLNEALWGQEGLEHFIDYATLFNMPFSLAHAYDGAWGNVVLSKHAFVNERVMSIHNRSGLLVTLPFGNEFGLLKIGTYHPHPSRYPSHKAEDFRALCQMVGSSPGLICGDFNAISPRDNVDEVALTQAFKAFSKTPASSLARFTEGGRKVFGMFDELQWHDAVSLENARHTMPTRLFGGEEESAMRIDHVMHNNYVKARSFIVQNDLTHFASDHYPVVTDIVL